MKSLKNAYTQSIQGYLAVYLQVFCTYKYNKKWAFLCPRPLNFKDRVFKQVPEPGGHCFDKELGQLLLFQGISPFQNGRQNLQGLEQRNSNR